MTNKDLEQYVNRLKTGDKSAFSPIYEATYKNVYFMCYSVVKDKSSAEDLTQDTYIRMYEKILSYENGTNFNAWLTQIAKNLSLNYIKKHNKETLIDLRHPDGVIPYTVSYKPQKIVDAMREEDLPDILNFGHFLVQDTFYHHGVLVNQVPSICATTPEMIDKGYNNIIGATVLTIRFTNKGKIQSIDRMFLNYRSIIQEDFKTFKVLSEGKKLVK